VKKKLLLSTIILASLIVTSVVTHAHGWHEANTQKVGKGTLIDAYALSNGGSLTIFLYQDEKDFYVTISLVDPDDSGEPLTQIVHHRSTPPENILTEVCNGMLHVWSGWGEEGIYHWRWDLPLEGKSAFLPMVCKDTAERR
jgi:hypothetical protein